MRRYFEMTYPTARLLDIDGRALYPLFVTLGAATDPERPVQTTIEGYFIGLSKRSFQAA